MNATTATIGEITEVGGRLHSHGYSIEPNRCMAQSFGGTTTEADDQIAIADTTIVIEDADPSEARLAISNTAP